ncbi:MAG: caspase family protein [Treponema sp.]|nr:caspase family protein [Treponema sp.]
MRIKGLIFGLVFCFVCLNVAAQRGGELEGAFNVEIYPQLGHTGHVASVVFSPDGKQILSGSGDSTIKLWDVDTGRELRTFAGYSNGIRAAAFSPDGKQIISCSGGAITLWDVATGKEIRTIIGHENNDVFSVAFSPDGRHFISGSTNNTIRLWDTATGREIRTFTEVSGWVWSVSFSPDGRQIICSSGNTIKLWDITTGREIRTFTGHTDFIYSVAFSSDGRLIISGAYDNTIKLWDTTTGREIRTLNGHTHPVYSVAFSPDGRQIISGSGNHTYSSAGNFISGSGIIKLWDVNSGREIRTFNGHSHNVMSVAFSPDGKQIVSGSWDNTIILWDVASGQEIKVFSGYTSPVGSVAISPDGRQVITATRASIETTGTLDNTIKLWDIFNGREIRRFFGHSNTVRSIAFNPNGRQILSGSSDDTIRLWETSTGINIRTFSINSRWGVSSVSFSPDGERMVSSSTESTIIYDDHTSDHTIRLLDISTGNEIRSFTYNSVFAANYLIFDPAGKYILSSSGNLKLWDVATGREVITYYHGHFGNSPVAFSPDGNQILACAELMVFRTIDTKSGNIIRTFSGHTSFVFAVAYSPDGRQIVSGSADGTIKLWDTATGREIRTFTGHLGWVSTVAFTPNGRHIVSSDMSDGTTRLWDVASGREIAQFISFTDGEWIVITPDGFYNASPNGDKHLNVRIGNNVYGIDQYRHTFYRPQIVEARLQGRPDPVNQLPVIQQAGEPPVVTILSPQNNARVNASHVQISGIIESRQPIRNMRVLINGRLVSGNEMRGMRGVRSGDLEATGVFFSQPQNRVEFSFNLDLVPGNNHIEIIANNPHEGKASIVVFKQQTAAQQTSVAHNTLPNLWILAVGVNRYDSPDIVNLNFAVNDAREIINAFKEQEGRVYQRVNSRLIADGTAMLPTRENIIDGFDYLKNASPTDVVVLFIAGHGFLDINGNFFFMPSNASFTEDGAIRSANAISSRDIQAVLNAPGQKIVFIDACHSAGINSNLIRMVDNDRLVRELESYGSVVMASSKGSQYSQERLI